MRILGYFDLSEVNNTILEPEGAISVLSKDGARPVIDKRRTQSVHFGRQFFRQIARKDSLHQQLIK